MEKKSGRGFTLIELLVVIAIIGVLTVVATASYSRAQAKSRDARRKADLALIKVALESYFADVNQYPDELDFEGGELSYTDEEGFKTIYLKKVPNDPVIGKAYCYEPSTDNRSYVLGAEYETEAVVNCSLPGPSPTMGATGPPDVQVLPSSSPTSSPSAAPSQTPLVSPSATPSDSLLDGENCSPCGSLGMNYCCDNRVYEDSNCTNPGVGDFSCSPGECRNIWKMIDEGGDCVADMSVIGSNLEVNGACTLDASCGYVTYLCHYEDPSCETTRRRFTTCVCW